MNPCPSDRDLDPVFNTMNLRKPWQSFSRLALVLACAAGSAWASETRFIVSVVPQFDPQQTHQAWTPLLARLEQATGYRFQLRVYDNIPRFETEVGQGIPDLAFMNPYHMLIAHRSQRYRPLVRDDTDRLSGILVVRRDSPTLRVAELHGKEVSFPSPNALGSSLYLRALLAEKERITIHPVYAGNHQNVYRQVMRGDAPAGGGVTSTFAREPAAVQTQLRILYTAPDLPPHPLAAHPRVSDVAARKIADALLALRHDATGKKLLAAVQLPQPVSTSFERDYAPLQQLHLDRHADKSGQ